MNEHDPEMNQTKMLYTIITENKNAPGILSILEWHVKNFTLLDAVEGWKGLKEPALVILLVDASPSAVQLIAEGIKAINDQEKVLVLAQPVTASLI